MIGDLENDDLKFLEFLAFRGSAKSTIASLAFPLWRALFRKDPFIVIIGDTYTQAKQIIGNIIYEFETNRLLNLDFGIQRDRENEWTMTDIITTRGVRISARSRGQKMRGMRHRQYRPTLVIADDIENLDMVRTIEQRNKTEEWMLADVLPSMDQDGRFILLGNLLHADSLVSRIKKRIESGEQAGLVRAYPLFDDDGHNLWEAAYPPSRVKELEQRGKRFYSREYLLRIVEADDQVVTEIQRYDTPPPKEKVEKIVIGVDLAISLKKTADYTALVASGLCNKKAYTLRTKYGRYNFNDTLEVIGKFYESLRLVYKGIPIEVGIEDVAYQKSAIEEAQRRFRHMKVVGIKQTNDKRANLEALAPYIENGEILVREKGQEDLVIQVVNFGYEAHDDVMDAAMISWKRVLQGSSPKMTWL